MPFIPFPNVPSVPGVPQVVRKATNTILPRLATSAGIGQLVRAFLSTPVWGIYRHVDTVTTSTDGLEEVTILPKKRVPLVTPDSFRDFGYHQSWAVTTAIIQQGGFTDFNRVGSPYENRIRMTKGGSVQARTAFLQQIEALNGTDLYDIVTPEKTYQNVNLLDVEFERRGEKGAYWLDAVDVIFREIRTSTAQYIRTEITQPQSPSSANPQNNGVQQGTTSTRAVPQTVTK